MSYLSSITNKLQPFLYAVVKWHYRKPRWVTKRGLKIRLYPSVFHPGIYTSTDILLDYILTLPMESKSILELGAGNGFISSYLAKHKNCLVTSTDINPNAIKGIKETANHNQLKLKVIESDLFQSIPHSNFDYILINPPFYAKAISNVDEYAFYAGKNLEYFRRLFDQIPHYIRLSTKVIVILSENAPIENINQLANTSHLTLKILVKYKKNRELFFIYELILAHEIT